MILGYLQYSPVWLCTQLLLFLTSHSFLNLSKAISTAPISGNCFLKICNCLVLNPKDLLNSHLLRLLWSIRCGCLVSAWHTSLALLFCPFYLSPLLVSLPLIILKVLLITLSWRDPVHSEKDAQICVSSSSNFPFELQTCLLENCTRVSCCYLKPCRTFLSTMLL